MKTTRSEMKKQKLMTKDQMIDKMRKMNAKHNDNMESRKNALKTLMGGIPVGNKSLCAGSSRRLYILMNPINVLFRIM